MAATKTSSFFRVYRDSETILIHLRNVASITQKKNVLTFTYIMPEISGTFILGSGGVDSNPYVQTFTYETEKEAKAALEAMDPPQLQQQPPMV
jgi:hypothetical protein